MNEQLQAESARLETEISALAADCDLPIQDANGRLNVESLLEISALFVSERERGDLARVW